MHYVTCCICVCFFVCSQASALESIKIDAVELREHRIGTARAIHSDSKFGPYTGATIELEIIVGPDGQVESAIAAHGPEEFYRQAEAIEAKRRFRPFLRNGEAVRAASSDDVSIMPLEQWLDPKIPFPDVADLNSLRIRLKRAPGWGGPEYTVEAHGDGEVSFEGQRVLISGHHHGRLLKQNIQDLLASFRRADFFSLKDQYAALITDSPTYTVSISFDRQNKSVVDHVGQRIGMPEALADLENDIDRIIGTEKWTVGNQETAASLLAENWNFSADTQENRALFSSVVASGSPDLVQLFLKHHAPALTMTQDGESPLIGAAAKGEMNLVKQMLDTQVQPDPVLLSCTLAAAAGSGHLPLVKLLLDAGSQVNHKPCGRYDDATALMKAAASGKVEVLEEILRHNPDLEAKNQSGYTALAYSLERAHTVTADAVAAIVTILLNAGASPNTRDREQRTPVFYACSNRLLKIMDSLVRAGADPNAKDGNGQTALMSCFDPDAIKALLAAGADPTLRDPRGFTAAQLARHMGVLDKAELIESAIAQGQPVKQ